MAEPAFAPFSQKWPDSHETHSDDPVSFANVPEAQPKHDAEPEPAYFPAEHTTGEDEPVPQEEPASHGSHVDWPFFDAKVPAAHSMQDARPSPA